MEARTSGRPGGEGGPARMIGELVKSAQNARINQHRKSQQGNNQTWNEGDGELSGLPRGV